MRILKIWGEELSERQVQETIRELKDGMTLIAPTDTLYAIMCDALSPKAIEAVCRLKSINPEKTNLSIICSDISMAAEYAMINNATFKLLKELTPGPYTFICKAAHSLPAAFKRRKMVGIRIPNFTADRQLAQALGHPLLTTSIKYADSDYGINPELIEEAYNDRVDLMIQGPDGGLEPSTILDCSGNEIIVEREGAGPIDSLDL
ncbi:MAG: threonylcarbamoyl-AMP synthase [Muribaculaceae bacterium]|nr:threonylcarbamoyl-AMP synthase [Muribaculaceae bacterium]